MTRQTLVTIMVILGALYIARCDGIRVGEDRATLRIESAKTDASARATEVLRSRVAYSESVAVARTRNLAVARREIAVLKSRMIVPDSGNWKMTIAQRDTLIRAQDSLIARQDSALTLWIAVAAAKDTVITRLTGERDSYRALMVAYQKQGKKRLGCVGGASVTAGLDGRVAYGAGVTCGVRL